MSNVTLNLRTQKGFTLIELVIVIVIIGILAAVALPKFASLQADARVGSMKGAVGALQSANVAVYSAAQIQNLVNSGTGPNVCGTTATPVAVPTTFGFATDLDGLQKCVSLGADFTVATATLTYTGFANCKMTYTKPASSGAAPTYDVTGLTSANCS